ncbi:hypothetical protein CRYUN_Cryun22dG0067300 [Craigia yunnanensis]
MSDQSEELPLTAPPPITEPSEIDLEARPADQIQCRICLETDGRDFIAPCKCKGTSKYVHRECLDHWRAVKEGFAFAHCTTCKAPYHLRVHVAADRKWRTLKFQFFVTRDILSVFLAVQLIIASLAYLVYLIDGYQQSWLHLAWVLIVSLVSITYVEHSYFLLCWGCQDALLHAMIKECVMIWLSHVEKYASVAVSRGKLQWMLLNYTVNCCNLSSSTSSSLSLSLSLTPPLPNFMSHNCYYCISDASALTFSLFSLRLVTLCIFGLLSFFLLGLLFIYHVPSAQFRRVYPVSHFKFEKMCADCHLPGTLCMWTDCATCFESCVSAATECGCIGGAGEVGLPLLFIMALIVLGLFTVIGIFYSVLVATMVGQRIWQRHYHILAKRMLTKEYVVEDVYGEMTGSDWSPPPLPPEHVQQLKTLGLL